MNSPTLNKKDWRVRLLDNRRAAGIDAVKAQRLTMRLIELLDALLPASVGLYWPIRGEPDVRTAVREWAKKQGGVTLSLPETRENGMVYRVWGSDVSMERDIAGIPFPEGDTCVPAVILLPVLGFGESCRRLGYGGGYFDRYLAVAKEPVPITVGVAYEVLAVPESLFEPHDIPLSYIVTESALRINNAAADEAACGIEMKDDY